MGLYFGQFYVFPGAPQEPSGIHQTALRVQTPYTLEAHGITTSRMLHIFGERERPNWRGTFWLPHDPWPVALYY